MDAQNFDAKLSIEKVTKDNRAATVRIGLSGRISGQHVLNVYLVKVEGRWKVDDVKAVEEFSLAGKTRSGRLKGIRESPHPSLLPLGEGTLSVVKQYTSDLLTLTPRNATRRARFPCHGRAEARPSAVIH